METKFRILHDKRNHRHGQHRQNKNTGQLMAAENSSNNCIGGNHLCLQSALIRTKRKCNQISAEILGNVIQHDCHDNNVGAKFHIQEAGNPAIQS